MAGFKQTVQSHAPKMFLTFDGDAFDPNNRKLLASPQVFIDESGFNSNIMLHNEDETWPAYRMGIPSLIDIEQTDQRSTSFGWYGYQPLAMTRWPKAFVEVQHQSHLALTDNLGSYTVGFFVNKAETEDKWRDQERILGNTYTQTLNKRWIRKAGSFDIYYRDYWTAQEEIRFGHPAGGEIVWVIPTWFYAKKNFVVCTWKITEINPDVYLNEAYLYVNGHLYGSYTNTTAGVYPSSTTTTPIEIAGVINASAYFEDRQTSDLQLDQMFILNKALTQDEICRLYRKAKAYDNIAVQAQAQSYWPMTDVEDPASFVMVDMAGYVNGSYLGGVTKIARQQPAPSQVLGGSSVYYHNGGMAVAHRQVSNATAYSPVFNFNADWSVDFWVQFSNTDRSVMFSCQKDDYPHSGVLIEANRRNNSNLPGHIQLSVSQDYQISTMLNRDNGQPFNFNDGRFHHVAAVRKGSTVSLWIDGIKHGSVTAPVQNIAAPGPGQVYIMGAAPGSLNTTGYMSSLGVYAYALDDAEVRQRNLYSQIYRIQGNVTLQGNPYRATVRAFSHRTGALLRELESSSSSGDYSMTLYDNSLIDLMVMNKQDPNIRYRVYGPITPAMFEDVP